jgi:ribonuclease HII
MPDFIHENEGLICGVDEAGRGPLAGPVIAACIFIPHDQRNLSFWSDVQDSKKITAQKRERLFELITNHAKCGIGIVESDDIDRINILQATFKAMKLAYENMNFPCDVALVDGNRTPPLPVTARTLIKGDQISTSIAAASIIAKVTRDRMMKEIHAQFPHYGWDNNAGYGTAQHLKAIEDYGPSPHHRMSFAPLNRLKVA